MAAIRPRDLLSDSLLERLGGTWAETSQAPGDVAATLSRDIAKLGDVGYLNVALPPEFGGLGCTLRQAACGQRRLARHAPVTALAVSAHLYWTGAAADAYRAGDDSARWILLEAARGALFAAGHGAGYATGGGDPQTAGGDLQFADPRSRCEPAGESGYRFRDTAVLSSLTPAWDWLAVHAVHAPASAPARSQRRGGPDSVLAFAGRGSRCTPAFRVARVQPAGAPGDVFTTSAVGWGHSILASVQYSDARRAFNAAVAAAATAADGRPPGGGHPLDGWPVAEAGLRLDAMKAKIAEITHPWPPVPGPGPDLGGQRLIGIYTMRHEVAEGARRVLSLTAQIADAAAVGAR
jgi:alkylation response protein AidB-like acyl-CoA dehydrogenase